MRNTLRKPRPGHLKTEPERLPSYASTLSQVPRPETARLNRGHLTGEPLPPYAPAASTSVIHDMKAAQKSQLPEPELETIKDNADIEANQLSTAANNPTGISAKRPAASVLNLVPFFALLAIFYFLFCVLSAWYMQDYIELKDEIGFRSAWSGRRFWPFPLASLGIYTACWPAIARSPNPALPILIIFSMTTLVPFVIHVVLAYAGPTPKFD